MLLLKGLGFKAFEYTYCCQVIYVLIHRESILLNRVISTCQAVPVKQCCLNLKNTVMLIWGNSFSSYLTRFRPLLFGSILLNPHDKLLDCVYELQTFDVLDFLVLDQGLYNTVTGLAPFTPRAYRYAYSNVY